MEDERDEYEVEVLVSYHVRVRAHGIMHARTVAEVAVQEATPKHAEGVERLWIRAAGVDTVERGDG